MNYFRSFSDEESQIEVQMTEVHSVLKGGGVRKMFFSETTKGLFWSIGSSYWMFNLGVHI